MLKVVGASWLQTKISSYILAGMGILAIVALFIGEIERIEDDGNYAATVYWTQKSGFRIEFWGQGNDLSALPMGAARAYYRLEMTSTGWNKLEIESNEMLPDWVQAYAAGLIEGALTWQVTYWHWHNLIYQRCEKQKEQCDEIRQQLESNKESVEKRASRNMEDPLWHHIHLYYRQVDGVAEGWNYAAKRSRSDLEIPEIDFFWLNALNDISVIEKMLNISSDYQAANELPGLSAAFFRLVPDAEENEITKEKVIVAHNSAGSYNKMLRLMKHYKLNYGKNADAKSDKIPGRSIKFSSYPGVVSSQDELYIVSGEDPTKHCLAVTGTTINNFNQQMWNKVNLLDHVLIGPRVMSANRLAKDGLSWARLISRVSSGTALAQWSVLNLKKLAPLNNTLISRFSPTPSPDNSLYKYVHSSIDGDITTNSSRLYKIFYRKYLPSDGPGLLWAIEQLPGYTHAADQSNILRAKGYWADYGIPHYQDMKELSGTKVMEAKYGNDYSLLKSPRAILFKNGFETAIDVNTVTLLMRSNHYDKEVVSNDKLVTQKTDDGAEQIDPEDIASDSDEVKKIMKSLETVKTHIEAKNHSVVVLTNQELSDISLQVNEILAQLAMKPASSDESESESEEHLNLESDSVEDIEDKLVDEGSWHGLGARGDLHGWMGEDRYGLMAMGVIDTKAFSATTDGIEDFEAISGPAYSRALETPIESLLKPATRKKAKFGLAALFHKIKMLNAAVSSEESSSSEEGEDDEEEPLDFEEALEHVATTNLKIDPPKPYSVPAFNWSRSDFKNVPHKGHPNGWMFNPIKLSWVW